MPANAPPRADIESHVVADGTRITLVKPDDFHHHFRDGAKVPDVLSHASERFARCIAMPNLKPVSSSFCMLLTIRRNTFISRSWANNCCLFNFSNHAPIPYLPLPKRSPLSTQPWLQNTEIISSNPYLLARSWSPS